MPLDEISKSIGKLEGQVENLKEGQDLLFEKQAETSKEMIKKIEEDK